MVKRFLLGIDDSQYTFEALENLAITIAGKHKEYNFV